ncbi:MAG: hypothetical protein ACJ72R_17050 [Nitrososphaeraceae archaeon]
MKLDILTNATMVMMMMILSSLYSIGSDEKLKLDYSRQMQDKLNEKFHTILNI